MDLQIRTQKSKIKSQNRTSHVSWLASFALLLLISSCKTPRSISYFVNVPDTASMVSIPDTQYKPIVIKVDDLLQINVSSPNDAATKYFVTSGSSTTNITNGTATLQPTPNIYLVDKDGAIDMPLAGRMVIAGQTTVEAKEFIKQQLLTWLKDPIVTVRVLNFKVTVLGEVNKPGSYVLPAERVSVLDALGLAGDLTVFARRDNVLLVREKQGKKVLSRLNLYSTQLFQSPYYYLQQNDLIYVEPDKSKAIVNDRSTVRAITIITAVISLATILISRVL